VFSEERFAKAHAQAPKSSGDVSLIIVMLTKASNPPADSTLARIDSRKEEDSAMAP